ncbi:MULTISPECIES: MerR family transcriptional regulator [unclassified Curtobacterium]|uniref:MerR family transcriptional regulator n=1 Tax=unclassified Curtobacterium TaxID=257496 RepID=UPI0008DD3B1A|nr:MULTISPECIES: MerR family transcriptional regulator [unclassified Curtobacterium]OIH99590.1 MerR family transcriptional regulator [Curtobacterium sp. MCBA15_003]OII30575.1 MerR family transcriptional regulator [Curtobacterium sp. MMLR14_006]
MPPVRDLLSIGEVSARTGLSVDTLRFYEREGLFPPPQRSAGGRRGFSAADLGWIGICQRLRASGMPLPEIARYAAMVRAGSGNEGERLELLQRHEAQVRAQMAVLQDALDLISTKVAAYTEAVSMGTASGLFVSDDADDAYFAARSEASSQRCTSTS